MSLIKFRSSFLTYIILCLWCWAPLAQLRAIPLSVFLSGSPPATGGYTAYAAGFDGTDYARKTTAWTNIADSYYSTCSFWVKFAGSDSAESRIFSIGESSTVRYSIERAPTTGLLNVYGQSSGSSTKINFSGSTALTAAMGWIHVFIVHDNDTTAADTNPATAGNVPNKIYINGTVETMTFASATSGTSQVDLAASSPRFTVGGSPDASPTERFNGDICEFYFWDSYHDIPSEFRASSRPTDLGATGNGSSAGTPDIYLSRVGSGDSWVGDSSGNSNTFTLTGTLTSPTAP